MAWYEQRSARLCLNQLNPIAAWLGEGGAELTSNHISGAAVLEYGPTEISAPLQPIWTSKCASLPTAPPTQPRIPARLARFSTGNGWVCARHGLSAGGRWIRTSGSAHDKASVPRPRFGPPSVMSADSRRRLCDGGL